ncbi:thioredoxin family protein [Robiginitalea sp. SC105]|uniref:thioredoxin family protein n=1 Tax=Robiginitalea sp. SC105 TaxID=2762332 RepID=UPI001639B6AF|nr:thioredoxin family protein [Robiginitalea sp. SC105]MBC2837925.1 thioredoxin family protein [Robiginitalea sp. SC105]
MQEKHQQQANCEIDAPPGLPGLLARALDGAVGYGAYREAVGRMAEKGETSGAVPSEANVQYTRLNHQRMNRWDKTLRLDPEINKAVSRVSQPLTWLVLTESWCGDAAPVLPVMHAIARQIPSLDLRIASRDGNPELMEHFRTDGALSIPKLIAFDPESLEVGGCWGPRPAEAKELVRAYKAKHGKLTPEFRESLQMWYNRDKGRSIARELAGILFADE